MPGNAQAQISHFKSQNIESPDFWFPFCGIPSDNEHKTAVPQALFDNDSLTIWQQPIEVGN